MKTVQVQIRYNSKPTAGKVSQDDDGNLTIELDEPVSAIAPSAVLYDPEFGYILCVKFRPAQCLAIMLINVVK